MGAHADDAQVEPLAGIMGGDATAVSDDTRNVKCRGQLLRPEAIQGVQRAQLLDRCRAPVPERGVDPKPDS